MKMPEKRYESRDDCASNRRGFAAKSGGPQNGAVRRLGSPQHDMIAAARAGVPAIKHELLGTQPRLPRGL